MTISIRKLKMGDLKAFGRLLQSTLDGLADRYYPKEFIRDQKKIYTTEVLTRKIIREDGLVLGAFEKDKLVGFIIAGPMTPGLFFGEWVGINPRFRRQGIISRFLRHMESVAKKTGNHKVYFYTSLKNIPAAKAYLKYGYEIEGVLSNHFGGIDSLIFGKSLSHRRFSKKYQAQPDFKIELE